MSAKLKETNISQSSIMSASSEQIAKLNLDVVEYTTKTQTKKRNKSQTKEGNEEKIQEMEHQIKLLIEEIANLKQNTNHVHENKKSEQQEVNNLLSSNKQGYCSFEHDRQLKKKKLFHKNNPMIFS